MDDKRRTVLIVDDAVSNIEVLKNILCDTYKVKVAISGEVALKVAQKEPHPDVILLDVIMPGMDGYEVCRQLKTNRATTLIPVLFVTGTADDNEVIKGLGMGAEGFIMKPLEAELVLEAVIKAIRSTAKSN